LILLQEIESIEAFHIVGKSWQVWGKKENFSPQKSIVDCDVLVMHSPSSLQLE
jgi:hypothetical protein